MLERKKTRKIVKGMGGPSERFEEEAAIKERRKTRLPPEYKVILLNDDYTTMEFVVQVLQLVFHLEYPEAERVMLSVHERGAGVAGIFTKEIAETKVHTVHALARQREYPLRCILEPA